MRRYEILMLPSAEKDLAAIPQPDKTRLLKIAGALADNPRPAGAVKLSGYSDLYRIRSGHYRIVYEIHDKRLLIVIAGAGGRDKIYKIISRRMPGE